jgi:hypothetical protein
MSKAAGFADPRAVESKEITINNQELQDRVGTAKFFSVTYRLFKINPLESDCEEYGHAIRYRGGIEEMKDLFVLDSHHLFEKGRMYSVCGNSYLMLHESRFREYFDFYGDFEKHYGIFEGCGLAMPFKENSSSSAAAAPCC